MMLLVTQATFDRTPLESIEGGYIQINKKVWQGILRNKRDRRLLWQCDHVHSRPEYNARYYFDEDQIWECSALNCGIEARYHAGSRFYDTPKGAIGLIGRPLEHGNYGRREDVKQATVSSEGFVGHLSLRIDGYRQLRVWNQSESITGDIILEAKKNADGWPLNASYMQMTRWLTAVGLLHQNVWGLSFRKPGPLSADSPRRELIELYTPKRNPLHPDGPHMNTVRESGKRLYAVVDDKGDTVLKTPHRGKAARQLSELEKLSKEGTTP